MLKGSMHERERWQTILTTVQNRSVVTVRELIERTGASPATLRRDLAKLEMLGQIRRVHGGVETLNFDERPHLATRTFEVSQALKAGSKRAIGRAAAALCQDNESIIINAGTTTFQMVDFLRDRKMQILTNSFPIAEALVACSENRIIMPGGEIYREQGIILSPFDGDAAQHYTASKIFMGCYSIGPLGVIEGDPLIARAEAKLLGRADKLIILADSSKFEKRGSMAVCPLSRVDTLITDDAAPQSTLEVFRQAGIDVIVVPEEGQKVSSAA
jgi:DeoR family transcriptional regulator, ulaG and ulaABCDEF operon transcriptional repressor